MPLTASLKAIEYHVPDAVLRNEELRPEDPTWGDKVARKTGILERRIAGPDETSADLAYLAAKKLFESGAIAPEDVDYLLFCTQTPDHFLPTTACLLQHRLGIPTTSGALDFNLGCSAFIYGLGLAKGLIETGQARNVLLLTGETYTKLIHPDDGSVRSLFGDAGSASLISAVESDEPLLGPFVYGTDGKGGNNLIVPTGGFRKDRSPESAVAVKGSNGYTRAEDNLYMNGPAIFTFTLETVPPAVQALLDRSQLAIADFDQFVFHQANKYMLEQLRDRCEIPEDRFPFALEDIGNTVSNTIPITLKRLMEAGKMGPGTRHALIGFGVGYSWGGCVVQVPS